MLKVSDIIQIRSDIAGGDLEMEAFMIVNVASSRYSAISLKTGEMIFLSFESKFFIPKSKEKMDIILNLIERANAR